MCFLSMTVIIKAQFITLAASISKASVRCPSVCLSVLHPFPNIHVGSVLLQRRGHAAWHWHWFFPGRVCSKWLTRRQHRRDKHNRFGQGYEDWRRVVSYALHCVIRMMFYTDYLLHKVCYSLLKICIVYNLLYSVVSLIAFEYCALLLNVLVTPEIVGYFTKQIFTEKCCMRETLYS